jgi:hypothetical protein
VWPFFKDKITAYSYPNILTPFIALLEERKKDCWFQQDRTTADTAKTTASSVISPSGVALATTTPRP